MPGNPGIARLAECIPSPDLNPQAIFATARSLGVELTIVGPEAPLVAGIVDLFRNAKIPIVGPTAEMAKLEGSKVYAKKFFEQHGIPTARFEAVFTHSEASTALNRFSFPVVIKADGLAAGKGVVIAQNKAEAEAAIAAHGPVVVIEEFLTGPEVSFIALCDGRNAVPLLPSRDHKRAFDGDCGPNTGGMGAYCDAALLSGAQTTQVMEQIIWPTVEATSFTGFLYAGLMLTDAGPKLLEYNVRLGDPETQALMHHFDDDLAEFMTKAANGELGTAAPRWKSGASQCVVLAAQGYPGPFRSGDTITGIAEAESAGAAVFHAGTRIGWSGFATAGGRVLGVTSSGTSLNQAAENTYTLVKHIQFDGMHYRRDIGTTPPET